MYGKTVDELLVLCNGGPSDEYDPLHGRDEASLARVHRMEWGGVYLQGIADGAYKEGEYADDLLIVIVKDGWTLFYRDPDGVPGGGVWGREWLGGHVHEDWQSLLDLAYSL